MSSQVSVNLYDLSNGMAAQMSPMLLGKRIEGIWHTGIVVYGKEYYYGGGICKDPPARTPYGSPLRNIPIGPTEIPVEMFEDFLQGISNKFAAHNYDLFKNNCNNFSNDCCEFQTGLEIPKYITGLPDEVQKTPMGGQIMNMVSGMQQQASQGSNPMFYDQNQLGGGQGNPAPPKNNFGTPGSFYTIKSDLEYDQIIQENKAVVVDFYTDWCGHCKTVEPHLQSLCSANPSIKFIKVNGDNHKSLLQRLGIQGFPNFRFYGNGKVVHTVSGANQPELTAGVNLLKSSYSTGNQGVSMPPPKPKTYQGYKPGGHKVFFENDKYETPLKKINEFGTSKGLFKDKFASQAEKMSNSKYLEWENTDRILLIDFVMENLPVSDPDNCLPFMDFLTKASLVEPLNAAICANKLDDLIMSQLDVYFKNNSYEKEKKPESCRIITWRFITNLTKFGEGYKSLIKHVHMIIFVINMVFDSYAQEKNLTAAVIQAMNNIFVGAQKPLFDVFGEKIIKLSKDLWNFASHTNDLTVVCCFCLLCWMYCSDKKQREEGLTLQEVEAKTTILQYHKHDGVKLLVEDFKISYSQAK